MRRRTPVVAFGVGAVVGLTAAALAYPRYGRDACLHWGATDAEVLRELPGDDLLADPDIESTRAVTVDAPASAIWPWLVQIGPGRGGAYTYDWIENLFGLDMHSASRVLPQFQDLARGDVVALSENGPKMRVAVMDPDRALVFASDDGHWVWAFVIDEAGGRTRLMSRNRIVSPDANVIGRALNTVVMEPGSLVMERKMLLGIKERVEACEAA